MALRIDGSEFRIEAEKPRNVTKGQETFWESSRVRERQEGTQLDRRRNLLRSSLARALDGVLAKLESSIEAFSWPDGLPSRGVKVATQTEEDAERIQVTVKQPGEADSYYKVFSRGFEGHREHGLEDGDYDLSITLGDDTETVTVSITSDTETWDDVLDAAAAAVNGAELPVQASVLRVNNDTQRVPGLNASGSVLALYVDAGREAQDVSVDITDSLARELDLQTTDAPVGAADKTAYRLRNARRLRPSLYSSGIFAPLETTGLRSGTYGLTVSADAAGTRAVTVEVEIDEDETWEEVIAKTAIQLNGGQSIIRADVETGDRPEYSPESGERLAAEGLYLLLEQTDPKIGEGARVSDTTVAVDDEAAEFYDPTYTLPTDAEVDESYIAAVTANGWTAGNIYTFNGVDWDETAPAEDDEYYIVDEDSNYYFDGSDWQRFTGLAGALGLTLNSPGSDAELTVDGDAAVSATGVFPINDGRVEAEVTGDALGPLPMRISEPLRVLEDGVADVVGAYNDLRTLLVRNEQFLREGIPDRWREFIEDNIEPLKGIGLQEFGKDRLLLVNGDTFLSAAFRDPVSTLDLLAGEDGLFPDWEDAAAALRGNGLENAVGPDDVFTRNQPPWRVEFDNESDEKLLDLFG